MWLFLATEILLFAGLFAGYAVYRFQFPLAFAEGSRHLNLTAGTVNTVVLITSSFTVALAIHFARIDRPRAAAVCLGRHHPVRARLPRDQGHRVHGALPRARAAGEVLRVRGGDDPRRGDVLHALFPDDRPARLARHRRHERPQLDSLAHRCRAVTRRGTTPASSWAASTGTWSTWSGSSSTRCCT